MCKGPVLVTLAVGGEEVWQGAQWFLHGARTKVVNWQLALQIIFKESLPLRHTYRSLTDGI